MRSKWLLIFVIFLTIVNLTALTTLCYHRWHVNSRNCDKACPEDHLQADRVLQQRLGLSAEQLQRMRQIRADCNLQTARIEEQLADKRILLSQAIMTADTDSIKIKQICCQIDSLQAQMQRRVVNHLLTQKNILNLDQQHLFFAMVMKCCSMTMNNPTNCVMLKK